MDSFKTSPIVIENNRSNKKSPHVIFIKEGSYHEKAIIDSLLSHQTLVGEQAKNTNIKIDDYIGKSNKSGLHTEGSTFSLLVVGVYFHAYNMKLKNKAEHRDFKAVALAIKDGRAQFSDCQLLDHQVMLYNTAASGRCYFEQYFIAGTIDFIFGFRSACFEQCTVYAKKDFYLTAVPTPKEHNFDVVFKRCKLLSESTRTQVSLGMPWRNYAGGTAINYCLDKQIIKEGLSNWKRITTGKTARFSEYKSSGSVAVNKYMLPWIRVLSEADAPKYKIKEVLSGWTPNLTSKYKNGSKFYKHAYRSLIPRIVKF